MVILCVLESMPSAELKKMRRKQRKAELKAQAKLQEEKKGQLENFCRICHS